jgi:transposase
VQSIGRIAVPKFFWGGEATRATGNDCYCRSLDPELVKDLPGQRNTSRRCDHGTAEQPSAKEEVMDTITRVGVDLAKNVIQIHAVDAAERVVARRAITRNRFLSWFANLKPRLIAMEACSAAHYWGPQTPRARTRGPPDSTPVCRALPQGGARVKNDARDAEAICEAASRPQMRFVPVKSPAQQSVLVLHRMRTGYVEERTALINRLRGLLAEFGVFFPQRMNQLHKYFVDCVEDGSKELAGPAREALMRAWAQWQVLDQEIAWFDRQIAEHANQDT